MTAPCVQYIDRLNDIANKNHRTIEQERTFCIPTIAFVWSEISPVMGSYMFTLQMTVFIDRQQN